MKTDHDRRRNERSESRDRDRHSRDRNRDNIVAVEKIVTATRTRVPALTTIDAENDQIHEIEEEIVVIQVHTRIQTPIE